MNEKYTALAELVKMVLELQVFTVLCPRCVNALTLEVSRFVFADCVKQIKLIKEDTTRSARLHLLI